MSISRAFARKLPSLITLRLRAMKWFFTGVPAVGQFNFGDLRRLSPVSRDYGYDRGQPVDRYYIERFLETHAKDVRGRVLEIGDNEYTMKFGGGRVTRSDVLHVTPDNPKATFVGDLTDAPQIPSSTFDSIVLTQTLCLIYDLERAVATLHRILKPGGVMLVTVPGVVMVPTGTTWAPTWHWSFTEHSLGRLLSETFGEDVQVSVYGNILAAISFLEGLCAGELEALELDHADPNYPVTITARVKKFMPEP